MGAWIETHSKCKAIIRRTVAPHVGAWIETVYATNSYEIIASLPMWERGLKQGKAGATLRDKANNEYVLDDNGFVKPLQQVNEQANEQNNDPAF